MPRQRVDHHLVECTLSDANICRQTSSYRIYRLPYQRDVFWTHVRLSVFDSKGDPVSSPRAEILLPFAVDSDLFHKCSSRSSEWQPFPVPFPSVEDKKDSNSNSDSDSDADDSTPSSSHGVFLRVWIDPTESSLICSFTLRGYERLLPSAPGYSVTHPTKGTLYVFLRSSEAERMEDEQIQRILEIMPQGDHFPSLCSPEYRDRLTATLSLDSYTIL